MKTLICLLLTTAICLTGCGDKQKTQTHQPPEASTTLNGAFWQKTQAPTPGPSKEITQTDGRFTVVLKIFSTSDHWEQAKYFKGQTETFAGWKNLYIVTKENHSTLNWGKYKTIKAAKAKLKTAKNFKSPAGMKPYLAAIILPIETKDPGRAEWKLTSASGDYTVYVAEFYDEPDAGRYDRKVRAVNYCQKLRSRGKEAYYYHGPGKSKVTVGAFPESSFLQVVHGTVATLEIKDERITKIIDGFKYLLVNGKTETGSQFDVKSGK